MGLSETRTKLWDEILAEHIDDVRLSTKVFAKDVVHEFDYVGDLVAFDRDFFSQMLIRVFWIMFVLRLPLLARR